MDGTLEQDGKENSSLCLYENYLTQWDSFTLTDHLKPNIEGLIADHT